MKENRHLGQQSLHTLVGVVEFTKLPDDANTVEHFWYYLWQIFWLGSLHLTARLGKKIQKFEVVLSLLKTIFNLFLEFFETTKVAAVVAFKHLSNLFKFWLLKSGC